MARPSDADAERTRARILEVASQLLASSDDGALSTREVARNAEVSIGTLQYHFRTRAELVEACMQAVYERLQELASSFRSSLGCDAPPERAVEATVRQAFTFLCANRPFIRLLLSTITGFDERKRHDSAAVEQRFIDAITAGIDSQLSDRELQLRGKSVIMLLGRYAVMSDAALLGVTGCEDCAQAQKVVEDHLVSAAIALLVPR